MELHPTPFWQKKQKNKNQKNSKIHAAATKLVPMEPDTQRLTWQVYTTRFSKNICKTFSHLYTKSTETDREKIARVLALWQKYAIFDTELIDRLNRIASAASIDSAVHGSGAGAGGGGDAHHVKKFKRLQYLEAKLARLQQSGQEQRLVIEQLAIEN